jgi:hypothetical protein
VSCLHNPEVSREAPTAQACTQFTNHGYCHHRQILFRSSSTKVSAPRASEHLQIKCLLTSLTEQNLCVSGTPNLYVFSDFRLQHTSHQDVDFGPNLFNNVTISKAEHEYLVITLSCFRLQPLAHEAASVSLLLSQSLPLHLPGHILTFFILLGASGARLQYVTWLSCDHGSFQQSTAIC